MSARTTYTLVPHEGNREMYQQYQAMCDKIDRQQDEIDRLREVAIRVRQWRGWQRGESRPMLGGEHVAARLLKAIEEFDSFSMTYRMVLADGRYAELHERDGVIVGFSLGPGRFTIEEISAILSGAPMPGSKKEAVST